MATNFPTSLDSLTNPATTDQLNSPSHAAQHADANDAIEQLQAKVGVNSSAVTTSHDYKIAQLEAAITAGVSGTKLIYQDVRNQSGVSLTKGTPVRVTGSDGASGKLLVAFASNANEAGSSKTFGLVSSTINNNSNGQVVTNGLLENVDTTGAVDGDPVWLGANGAKIFGLVNKPVAPAHLVYLGVVVRGGQQNTGSIFVSIQNGFEVEELHNVLITSVANKNALVYDSTTQLWKNYDLSNDFVLSGDLQNSLGDYIPLSVLGEPDGVAKLDLDGNLIVPENKIIIEGATADAHELTLQAPDVTSDITVTLPNASGTLALTTDVSTAITNLVSSAPATLDTLNELATALGNDANFATTTATSIGNKVSKAGGDIITPSAAGVVGLAIKGAASQTANLQEWQDSAGNLLGRITSTGVTSFYGGSNIFPGDVRAGTSSYLTAALSVASRVATESGLVVRGFASQTANLQQWQNSSGTVLASIASNGAIQAGTYNGVIIGLNYPGIVIDTSSADSTQVWLRNLSATSKSGRFVGIKARNGYANAVAGDDLVTLAGEQYINSLGYESAKILMSNDDSTPSTTSYPARITFHTTAIDSTTLTERMRISSSGNVLINGFTASTVGLTVKGSASQTANLQEWQAIDGSLLGRVTSSGGTSWYGGFNQFTGDVRVGTTSYYDAELSVQTRFLAEKGIVIRGAASQTANLQEWQNSSGAILTRITAGGVIGTTQNIYANRYYYSGNGTDTATSISFIDGANGGGLNIRNIDLGTPNAAFDNVVPLTISGNINQTANLQNWKNAAGTVLAKVDSTGAMFTVTPAANTNTTQVATTAYVQTELADLVNSAPATLDTLNELATALGNDASFSTTVTNSIALKAPLASPALTGTPTAPTATAGTNTTQIATTAFVKTEITSSVQPGAVYQTSAPSSPAVGQIWIDSDQDVTTFDSNIIRRKSITATAGQTVFTTDLPFIDGFEQVFFNGLLLLKTSDYTTSGGNTVTLTSAAAVSDIVEIVTVTGANSVSTYTQAETDALLAANTSVAPLSISANTTLVAKKRYFVTSASALTLTLPASPALNDEIQILDASGNASTYNITVARNGNKINGGTGNLIIDMNGAWTTLLYTGSTYGWKVG